MDDPSWPADICANFRMSMGKCRAITCLVGMLVSVMFAKDIRASEWFDDGPSLLCLAIGAGEILERTPQLGGAVEYRPALRFCHLGPWMSLGRGQDHEIYASLGVLLNLRLGDRWVLTPAFGGGYYASGDGFDLGCELEFRSAIELSCRLTNHHRVGCVFGHLSNGGLVERNPGTEMLFLVYAIPLDGFFKKRATSLE